MFGSDVLTERFNPDGTPRLIARAKTEPTTLIGWRKPPGEAGHALKLKEVPFGYHGRA